MLGALVHPRLDVLHLVPGARLGVVALAQLAGVVGVQPGEQVARRGVGQQVGGAHGGRVAPEERELALGQDAGLRRPGQADAGGRHGGPVQGGAEGDVVEAGPGAGAPVERDPDGVLAPVGELVGRADGEEPVRRRGGPRVEGDADAPVVHGDVAAVAGDDHLLVEVVAGGGLLVEEVEGALVPEGRRGRGRPDVGARRALQGQVAVGHPRRQGDAGRQGVRVERGAGRVPRDEARHRVVGLRRRRAVGLAGPVGAGGQGVEPEADAPRSHERRDGRRVRAAKQLVAPQRGAVIGKVEVDVPEVGLAHERLGPDRDVQPKVAEVPAGAFQHAERVAGVLVAARAGLHGVLRPQRPVQRVAAQEHGAGPGGGAAVPRGPVARLPDGHGGRIGGPPVEGEGVAGSSRRTSPCRCGTGRRPSSLF